MAVITDRAIFFHVPKTGGVWVRTALQKSGVHHTELRCKKCTRPQLDPSLERACCMHNTVDTALPETGAPRLRFAFVRHPLSYYQSYWAYRMRMGWDPVLTIDKIAGNSNFHEFVRGVLKVRPGWVTKVYERFVGSEEQPYLGFIGKQEQLADDLVNALSRAGESFDEEAMRQVLPENMSSRLPEWRTQCRYTSDLLDAVLQSESEAIRRFYPDTSDVSSFLS